MNPRVVPPLPDGSPWGGWALPDIKHCEANLGGWIAAPANTWSNLAYIGLGLWILRRTQRRGPLDAGGLGTVLIVVGLTSFFFHASYTFAGQVCDYAGMFLLLGWALARGLHRVGLVTAGGAVRFWGGLSVLSLLALFGFHAVGWGIQTLVLVQALAVFGLELRLLLVEKDAPSPMPFWVMQGLLLLAYACWHLDHADAFCRPDNHLFQLHALWHLLTAAAFVAAWRYHEGVDSRSRAKMEA